MGWPGVWSRSRFECHQYDRKERPRKLAQRSREHIRASVIIGPKQHDLEPQLGLSSGYQTSRPLKAARVGRMSDFALPIVLGVALAAATGFRVFLPMLIVSAAAYTGHLSLDNSFAWLGTPAALTMLSVAAGAEILAYYIPVLDNLLDSLATPAAFIAGTIVSAAVMTDVPPMVKWTAAVIAGGGIAGLTQGATAALRAHSTVLTGGFGNPIIATLELGGALLMSFLAFMAPAAAVALIVLFLWLAIRLLRQVFPGDRSKYRKQ